MRTGLRVPAPQSSASMISIARSQRSVSLRGKSAFSLPAFLFSLRKKEMMKENFIICSFTKTTFNFSFAGASFSTFLLPEPKRKVAKEKGSALPFNADSRCENHRRDSVRLGNSLLRRSNTPRPLHRLACDFLHLPSNAT